MQCMAFLCLLVVYLLYLPERYLRIISEAPQDEILAFSIVQLILCCIVFAVVEVIILRLKVLHSLTGARDVKYGLTSRIVLMLYVYQCDKEFYHFANVYKYTFCPCVQMYNIHNVLYV